MVDPLSFYKNLGSGVPLPQVDPEDLKRVWKLLGNVQATISRRRGEVGTSGPAEQFGIHHEIIAQHCSPNANVPATMLRCQYLGVLLKKGVLAPWLDGENPSELLFREFALYPVHIGEFDVASFVQDLQEKGSE